tara:strand:- start:361 stop:1926 length:1566 start_codon:yes stop_codon:yes gene_type:complete
MGLYDNSTHREYYKSNTFGGYQFTSLDDIITQFEIAYVGEGKIIPKIKRADIAFHAQRGLQEFSFDTLKSIKSQQIDIPASLTMKLPHDYVNYTKISWVDSSGIKHPLYHTNDTSNPFQVYQDTIGDYTFPSEAEQLINGDFSSTITEPWHRNNDNINDASNGFGDFGATIAVLNDKLQFAFNTNNGSGAYNWGSVTALYQEIDVSSFSFLSLSANGTAISSFSFSNTGGGVTGTGTAPATLRFGLMTSIPSSNVSNNANSSLPDLYPISPNISADIFDLSNLNGDSSYLEWTGAASGVKTVDGIDVSNHNKVYAVVVAYHDFGGSNASGVNGLTITYGAHAKTSFIDDVSIKNTDVAGYLSPTPGNNTESSTWNSYKSLTPAENNNDDYEDDTYWPANGERYGLDPQHAQVNGSFYIDPRVGRIHFSSNVSGKSVILDYISDSLGTDGEMQVHKFAEEAMYKWIAYAILSTSSSQLQQQLAPRFKKERFAATRQAKLRLSNIKLEQFTQILRGKSKQIKH